MWPSPKIAFLLLSAHGLLSSASPTNHDAHSGKRQSCPDIHVFGARETTASAGYGSSATVVNAILSAYSGSTAEAIDYPACGGQSSCGSVSYSSSVQQGIAAAASAVNNFYTECPSTQLVLVGYSQVCALASRCEEASSNASRAVHLLIIWYREPRYSM